MNPYQMPTANDWRPPTIKELGENVRRARQNYQCIAMTQMSDDEVERMRASILLDKAATELANAEHALRAAIEDEVTP